MSQDTLIEVHNLTRFYASHCAVNGINFKLRRGQVTGFLGPNGAGKSTTLQMLAGTLAPSNGSVLINGIDLLESPRQAKQHIGYLPEIPPLYADLTVDEYLQYCALLHGVASDRLGEAMIHARYRCGLDEVASRLIRHLSKGYQQRVGIAQAIIHNPPVVMLDEPTVGLDPNQIREIRKLIRSLAEDHCVILSTHILPEVQSVCDRVLVIHQGRVVLDESMAQLKAHQHGCLRIRMLNPPPQSELERIDEIERVQPMDDTGFLIFFKGTESSERTLSSRLAATAAEQDWGLYELSPQRQTLEDLFVQLTCQEDAA